MYALTVNDIDAQTYARISSIAFEEECSLSQVLHRLICVALEKYPLKRKSGFARFAGRWTAEEAVAFNELTQRTVDYTEWRKGHLFVGETVDTLVDKIRVFESEHPELAEVNHA